MLKRIIFVFFLLPNYFGNLVFAQPAVYCQNLLLAKPNRISEYLKYPKPILVVHGRSYNSAPESTWQNIKNSLLTTAGVPFVLELDLQLSEDKQLVVVHDPTFHRLSKDYRTSQETINNFWLKLKNNPNLYEKALEAEKKGEYFFNLFDGVSNYSLDELKKRFWVYDNKTQIQTELITLNEILNAAKNPGQFEIPEYEQKQDLMSIFVKPERLVQKYPVIYYFDLKAINHLARRYLGLPDWHWLRNAMTLPELEEFTKNAIEIYANLIRKYDLYDYTLITARHPKIFEMIQAVDANIKVMISSEALTPYSDPESFKKAFEPYLSRHSNTAEPLLIEVKYLSHLLNKDIRDWIQQNNLRLFFNQIKETDIEQFSGIYKGNLSLLIQDILQSGENIWIQTNTVHALAYYLLNHKLTSN